MGLSGGMAPRKQLAGVAVPLAHPPWADMIKVLTLFLSMLDQLYVIVHQNHLYALHPSISRAQGLSSPNVVKHFLLA
jgi:hypothetical protein